MNQSKLFLFVLVIWITAGCNKSAISQIEKPTQTNVVSKPISAKNVILMIGDGMGLGQLTAGMLANGNKTNFDKFTAIGLHKNSAFNDLITDSAAGATAFASGVKTYNGAIGVNSDTIAVQTILEEAEEKGLKTGLIATSTITHATPAAFIAHDPYRKNYEAIALDFMDTDIDLFIGGGSKHFNQREDELDLYQQLRDRGYQVEDYFSNELSDVTIDKTKKFAYLTALESPLPQAQGRNYLMEATKKAIDYLSSTSPDGFFLMIEGSQIDWGGHANKADYIISEMIEFDHVVGYVADWTKKDKNTLLVVTADHETGGFAIQKGSTQDSLVTAFTSDYHTGVMIPVFAMGPFSEQFIGIYENTMIYNKMRKAYGWKEQ